MYMSIDEALKRTNCGVRVEFVSDGVPVDFWVVGDYAYDTADEARAAYIQARREVMHEQVG